MKANCKKTAVKLTTNKIDTHVKKSPGSYQTWYVVPTPSIYR